MIPYRDQPEKRRRTTPYVMLTIVALNVLVFLYELSLGAGVENFIAALGVIPYDVTTGTHVGAASVVPPYLTILTSMFIHAGLLHIAGNMLFLWVFGDNVEDLLGHFTFLVLYLVCGIGAALAQIAADPFSQVPSIGASGAIAGVLAAYMLLFPRATVDTLVVFLPLRIPALLLIGFWIVWQLFSGLASLGVPTAQTSGVAYWAHVGGFVVGLLITLVLRAVGLGARRPPRMWGGDGSSL
ncbi:MAG: rhomboid family intramembrane serine protease [Chloroflexota bacterium]|nr:MAG: rhomboid family intramembrane serine protease [Chloroflexota bacterium]